MASALETMKGRKVTVPNDHYIYPAIFERTDESIIVEFPDLPGCLVEGKNFSEAMELAKDALASYLYMLEQEGREFPQPDLDDYREHNLDLNQVVILVDVWMPLYRDKIEQVKVKKTLTIPKWLNDLADAQGINFSYTLEKALKAKLGLDEHGHPIIRSLPKSYVARLNPQN